MHRTFDAAFLNAVANDPEVRPFLGGNEEIDLSIVAADPTNFVLIGDRGGFVLTPVSAGQYEVHSLFLPNSGTKPVSCMKAAQDWMFTRTDCTAIWSKVPKSNRAAKGLALIGKLGCVFERDHQMFGPCEFVELSLMRWAMNCAALESHGERFHTFLEQAKAEQGSELPKHPHDPAHERAVGASLLMIERGQAVKGVAFYNLWAGVAGYQQIALLGLSPVVIDAGDAVVGLGENGMEILLCR